MIEHGQSKPLHSRIGWSLPEEARMRDETSCTHYRPETQSLDEYLEEVFRHLEAARAARGAGRAHRSHPISTPSWNKSRTDEQEG